jgi:hypothetical protein
MFSMGYSSGDACKLTLGVARKLRVLGQYSQLRIALARKRNKKFFNEVPCGELLEGELSCFQTDGG